MSAMVIVLLVAVVVLMFFAILSEQMAPLYLAVGVLALAAVLDFAGRWLA